MNTVRRYGPTGALAIHTAEAFATAAHAAIDQRRKWTGAPYIMHPESVVRIVQTVEWHTYQMVCAAWLHDVLEDTKVQTSDIDHFFGGEIGTMVYRLTDVEREVGNRAKRKAMDRQRLAESSREVQTIKVADLIDNTPSIVQHDPDFARVYLREKRDLLNVLTRWRTKAWSTVPGHCCGKRRVDFDGSSTSCRRTKSKPPAAMIQRAVWTTPPTNKPHTEVRDR